MAWHILLVLMDDSRDIPTPYKRILNWGGGSGCTTSSLLPTSSRVSWVKVSLFTTPFSPNERLTSLHPPALGN